MDLIPYKPYIQTIRPSTAQLGVPQITSHDAPCKWSRRVFSETPNAHVGYHLFLGLSPITLPQMLRQRNSSFRSCTRILRQISKFRFLSFLRDRNEFHAIGGGKTTHLKNISQIGSFLQVGVNKKTFEITT